MKYFCYEKNFAGKWQGVIYAERPEKLEASGKESGIQRGFVYEIEDSVLLDDATLIYDPPNDSLATI